jgi:hypothetical protein
MELRMKWVLVVTALLVSVSSVEAQDRVVGLLTLPEVFGDGPCHAFTPEEIPLYRAADAAEPIGAVRVDRYWRFPEAGGCEGLVVNVHMGEGRSVSGLPTKEYTYEAPAAVVLEARDGWFKLLLNDGVAWVQASRRNEYLPLKTLLSNGLTYVTGTYEGHLFGHPGGSAVVAKVSGGDSVRVMEILSVEKQLWIKVELLSHSICESVDEPKITAQGWIPAHGPSGQPTVWFHSRGC